VIALVIFLILLSFGYFVGKMNEERHFERLRHTEAELQKIKLIPSNKHIPYKDKVQNSQLVMGSTVISIDFFKKFLGSFYNLVGGRVRPYESLLDRARREAIIRMKRQAKDFDFIANIRIETSSIGGHSEANQAVGAIEVLAYGTAVKLVKK
jgi:uncharacterized protein YbjQ (UPF0145 family)